MFENGKKMKEVLVFRFGPIYFDCKIDLGSKALNPAVYNPTCL